MHPTKMTIVIAKMNHSTMHSHSSLHLINALGMKNVLSIFANKLSKFSKFNFNKNLHGQNCKLAKGEKLGGYIKNL
jgi:hypothetical protein